MIKLDFSGDYMEGAHPLIFERLLKINDEKIPGYGKDKYTNDAKEKILNECGMENGEVFFLAGGTQTNAVVISALLKFSEAVIGANTGAYCDARSGSYRKNRAQSADGSSKRRKDNFKRADGLFRYVFF